MRNLMLFIMSGALFVLVGCGEEDSANDPREPFEQTPRDPVEIDHAFSEGQKKFALDLFQETFSEHGTDTNTHVSPYSIQLAFILAANGLAESERQVILESLQLRELELDVINQEAQTLVQTFAELPHADLETANSIWHRPFLEVEESYQQMLEETLVGETHELPESNPEDAINEWVKNNTNSYIDELVKEVSDYVVAYIINAVYLDANWLVPFEASLTSPRDFHLLDGSTIEHPMMRQSSDFLYQDVDSYQALKIPYEDEGLSMNIILPEEGMFEEVVHELNGNLFWNEDWNMEQVDLIMPTFSFEAEYSLIPTLSKLGMDSILLAEIDFEPLFGPDSIYLIDEVLHKTFINVDEEGTEAAAVTAIQITESAAADEKYVTVDRPFVFAITDDLTETILFIGSVLEPLAPDDN